MKKFIRVLIFLILSFSFANASKILLLDKISPTELEFDSFDKPIISNNSHFFIKIDRSDQKYYVYNYKFKKDKKLSKNLHHYIDNNNYRIIGINGDLVILLNYKKNLKIPGKYGMINMTDRFRIRVINLVKNKILFTRTIRIPDGKMLEIQERDYYSKNNKNYILLMSQTVSKDFLYYLFINNKGAYKIKKIVEKNTNTTNDNIIATAKFGFPSNNIYIGHYKYNIKTNKFSKLNNIKGSIIYPLSKNILLTSDLFRLIAYNILDKSNLTFFYSDIDINEPIDFPNTKGDGDGDIFISYMHFPCDNCNPINKVYMLDAKNKVLMGDGFIHQTTMLKFAPRFLLKHFQVKRGVYSYILGEGKSHKLYHYLLVDTNKLRDYKYIKPSMLRNFHRIAPSLKLKNPKIILTSNNIHSGWGFFDSYGAFMTYKIPYMIKDNNKLYVLFHFSLFSNSNTILEDSLDTTYKLKLKSTILKTNNFYPKDKLLKINTDQETPGFTRVVAFKLPKGFKIKRGYIVSVGEALHPKKGADQVLNFKIGKSF